MKYRLLYLPIETTARELLGKILLAGKAVERGWLVITGQEDEVQAALFRHPPGVYIGLGIPENRVQKLKSYKSLGHRIANLDEENIVFLNGKDYCQVKMGPGALELVDLSFTSGERNDQQVREYRPDGADKFRIVGNPRFDTLLPALREVYEPEANVIRGRFGRFLLVNTNFSTVNTRFRLANGATDYISLLRYRGMIADDAHASFKRREIARKAAQYEKFKIMLAEIAQAGQFENIIIRPHPSENHDAWREWAQPHGAQVHFESNANAWMLAADAILHPGCTTGIEGLLLARPVASFVPDPGSPFLNPADEVSRQVADAKSFLAYAEDTKKFSRDAMHQHLAESRAIASRVICNVEPPLSCDRILTALDELEVPHVSLGQAGFGIGFGLRERLIERYNTFDVAARAVIRRRPIPKKETVKFPGLSLNDIEVPLRRWQRAGILKRVPNVCKLRGRLFVLANGQE